MITPERRGQLLFAHGARDPAWALPFQATARRCQQLRPDDAVVLGFLEFMRPGLVEAGQKLVAASCTVVDVVPLFLGAGGHVRKDIPVLLAQLRAEHPQVRWQLQRAIGEADAVIEAMAQVASAASADTSSANDSGAAK